MSLHLGSKIFERTWRLHDSAGYHVPHLGVVRARAAAVDEEIGVITGEDAGEDVDGDLGHGANVAVDISSTKGREHLLLRREEDLVSPSIVFVRRPDGLLYVD
jgi:hypothetical protein